MVEPKVEVRVTSAGPATPGGVVKVTVWGDPEVTAVTVAGLPPTVMRGKLEDVPRP